MVQADLSWLTYFLPIVAFLIVFLAIYIVLKKTDFIDNQFLILLFAFLVSSVFVSAAGAVGFVTNVLPWFGILAISLVFILALTGFVGKDAEFMHKGIGIAVVVILGLVFLI